MKRRIVWINITLALVLVTAAVGGYFWLFHSTTEATSGRTVAVQSGSVSETVTATGSVETAGTVDLSFTQGGTVTTMLVEAGDTVEEGQRLATVDDASAQSALTSAKRTYAQAVTSSNQSALSVQSTQRSVSDAQSTAKLNKKGYEQSVADAKQSLKDAKQALAEAKQSWSVSCLDPAGVCPSTDAWSQLRSAEADVTNAKTAYTQAVQNASADETSNNLKVNQADTNVASAQAKQNSDCATYGSSSSQCSSAQSGLTSAQQSYANTVNAQQVAAIQGQQSLVNADARITTANISLKKLQASLQEQAEESVETAQESVDTAQRSLDNAQLTMKKGVSTDEQSIVRAQESLSSLAAGAATVDTGAGSTTADDAAIAVARDGVAAANDALDETVLRSPVAGTVGVVAVDADQSVAAGASVLTLIPNASYQVVVNFSEADALKVAVGQSATVTFDALASESATGKVTAVDILPTTGENVTTYGATITLDDAPDDLLDGMSASAVVTVNEATGVLWVPSAAVTTAGGMSTVTLRKDGVDTIVPVTTGLAGDSGTEITTGVAEGDQLVVATTDSDTGTGFPAGGIPGGFAGSTGGGPRVAVQVGP